MTHLLQIEADVLNSAVVRDQVNFGQLFTLQSDYANANKNKFEKSLKLSKLVFQSLEWYSKAETKTYLSDEGIEFGTTEEFINRVLGYNKSFAYKLKKVGKLQDDSPQVVTKFKTLCTRAENNGEDANRSVDGLLKFAKAEANGEEQEVSREKTYATFSIAKDGINGEKGFSIRLTDSGVTMSGTIEDDNIEYNVNKLFGKLNQILSNL